MLRLVWQPTHFKDGKLQSSAFSRDEMKGAIDKSTMKEKYASVDDMAAIVKLSVDWRISWQQRDGRDVAEGREVAKFVEFESSALNSLRWSNNDPMFYLTPEPTVAGEDGPGAPANPAHWGIRGADRSNVDEKERSPYVSTMRTKLIQAYSKIFSYDQLFREDRET
ncbi:MAG: hypothetical protein ACKVKF_02975 [Rhodobacterales bacterium]